MSYDEGAGIVTTQIQNATEFIKDNVGAISAGVGGAVIGGAVGYVAGRKSSSKKRKRNKNRAVRKRSHRNKSGRKLKFGSKAYRKRYLGHSRRHKQKQPHTAGKRKDTSHRRIRYTKNNQPYVILPSGKARFISKKGVRMRRKRKGGSY